MADELFTVDEVLGGLPMRRAAALLFVIESRTAQLADRSRRKMELFATEQSAEERELAFFESFSAGREPPLRLTIHHLERFSPQWAPLVPENAAMRAALAQLIGRKYSFTRNAVPGIRAALTLDAEAVQSAYLRQFGRSLEGIYRERLGIAAWLSGAWAALTRGLELLSPFWMVFAITVAFSLSQAFLALPTGLAHVGPVIGAGVVLVIGFINVLTMACMAECCARNGEVHYGKGFLGALVTDYLGKEGSYLYTVATFIRTFLVALAGSIGFGLTFAAFTAIPATVWVVVLFVVEVFYLSRKLSTTLNTMVILTMINLVLFVPIVALAFAHADPANLFPAGGFWRSGSSFGPSALQLVLGVTIMLYIGHVGVIQCAKLALPRDPSGRSLVLGSIAGTCFLTLVFVVWLVAIAGAVSPQQLAEETGTALAPLARNVGAGVGALGIVLVTILLGVSCLKVSDILFKLVAERLRTRLRVSLNLPRRRGRVLMHMRGSRGDGDAIGLTYQGMSDGRPQFLAQVQENGHFHRVEFTMEENRNDSVLREHLPERSRAAEDFAMEIFEATPEGVRVRIGTSMRLTCEGEWFFSGRDLTDVLELPEPGRRTMNWLTRREDASVQEIAMHTRQNEDAVSRTLRELEAWGFVQVTRAGAEPRYRADLGVKRRGRGAASTWRALGLGEPSSPPDGHTSRRHATTVAALWIRQLMAGERGRFVQAAIPVLLVLILAEWLLLAGESSFAGVLGYAGVITNTLTAGIFPALLVLASRRKSDIVPATSYRALAHPVFTAGMCILFLCVLALHAFVIWDSSLARGAAVAFGLSTIAVIVLMLRRDVFAERALVEVRQDSSDKDSASFAVTRSGKPVSANICLDYASGREERFDAASGSVPALRTLRHATFELDPTPARELKVWVHSITSDGISEPIPSSLEIRQGGDAHRFDMSLCGGKVVIPLSAGMCSIKIISPDEGSH